VGVVAFIRRAWGLASAASVLAWLLSIGVGGVVSTLLASAVRLDQPWRSFFFVSALLVAASVTMPLAQAGFVWLAAILPGPPPPTMRDTLPAVREERARRQREQRKRSNRAALHEAITTLEHHKADIERYTRVRSPSWQGEWPENRAFLAQEPRYDRAVRATERAFQAVPYFVGDAAIGPIEEALAELQATLEDDEP